MKKHTGRPYIHDLTQRLLTAIVLAAIIAGLYIMIPAGLPLIVLSALLWILWNEWPQLKLPHLTLVYPFMPGLILALVAYHHPSLLVILAGSCIGFDTAAYIGGSLIGYHKMAPAISPGKTWEGTCAGFIGCFMWWYGYSLYTMAPVTLPAILWLTVLFGSAALVGDLLVSLFKRRVGIKDTGSLLPGHGGLLDRMDSLLFSAYPFIMLYAYFIRIYT